jgi:hypothetical protein
MRITYGAVLPLSTEDAFAFVADPLNWPSFSPGVREVTTDDDWGRVGSHAHLASTVLGRTLKMDLEVTEWDPPHAFRYTVSTNGGPRNDDNRRTFDPIPAGTRLTGTTEIPGGHGTVRFLLDPLQRILLRVVFATAMAKLPKAAAHAIPGRRCSGGQ